jgi:uncharacterized protein (TIGR02569 family)
MVEPAGAGPPDSVARAFGVVGTAIPLAGGRGLSWRVGDTVLKPIDGSPDTLEWQARELAGVPMDSVRLAAPLLASDGRAVVDGWIATPFLAGEHRARSWVAALAAGEALHRATVVLDRPAVLDERTDRWAIGDRVAWGEAPAEPFAGWPHVGRLLAALRPLPSLESQIVHGDLMGNVLFADGLPPGIIDVSPYWRPTGFAAAIVVADALVWDGADASLLRSVDDVEAFPQLLARALIYRLVADAIAARSDPARPDETDAYADTVQLAIALCEGA